MASRLCPLPIGNDWPSVCVPYHLPLKNSLHSRPSDRSRRRSLFCVPTIRDGRPMAVSFKGGKRKRPSNDINYKHHRVRVPPLRSDILFFLLVHWNQLTRPSGPSSFCCFLNFIWLTFIPLLHTSLFFYIFDSCCCFLAVWWATVVAAHLSLPISNVWEIFGWCDALGDVSAPMASQPLTQTQMNTSSFGETWPGSPSLWWWFVFVLLLLLDVLASSIFLSFWLTFGSWWWWWWLLMMMIIISLLLWFNSWQLKEMKKLGTKQPRDGPAQQEVVARRPTSGSIFLSLSN